MKGAMVERGLSRKEGSWDSNPGSLAAPIEVVHVPLRGMSS